METRRRSSWWFLLPILFSIIGGVIAYFVIKEDDPKKAKNCLLLGVILTAIGFAFFFIPFLIGMSFMPPMDMWENSF
jgi:4-hydroxybenzoate polyprenyltransferase